MENGGDATITEQNFTQKYIQLYNTNKDSNVIDAESVIPVSLPGELRTAADFGTIKQPNIVKRWDFNKTDQTTSSGTIIESMGGDKDSTYTNCGWSTSTSASAKLFSLWSAGQVALKDKGIISNASWSLQIKGTLNTNGGIKKGDIFSKGGFKVSFWVNNSGEGLKITSAGGTGYLRFTQAVSSLANKDFTLTVIRDNISVRILWNDTWVRFGFPNEFPKLISDNDSVNSSIVFTNVTKNLESVIITDGTWGAQDIVNTKNEITDTWHKYSARMDCDTTYGFFGWEHQFPDLYGNFTKLDGMPYGLGPDGTKHWVAPPSIANTNGHVDKTTCLNLKNKQKCELPSINFARDFTVSFWITCDYLSWAPFLIFESQTTSGKRLSVTMGTGSNLNITKPSGSTVKKSYSGFSPSASKTTWNHITIIKNGTLLNAWVNGKTGGWSNIPLTTSEAQTLGECVPTLKPPSNNKNAYFSHLRVVNYAMSHIPKNNIKSSSTWSFINDLKSDFETKILNWTP